jgi:ribosomal-protein-alanine N-acetyltransferase
MQNRFDRFLSMEGGCMAKIYNTERLILKMVGESDILDIVQFVRKNRNHLKTWEPERTEDYYTYESQLQQLMHEQIEIEAGRLFKLWIYRGKRIIGCIALNNIIRGAFQSCHLGYRIEASEQGKGYATESLRTMVDIAFQELHLHRIEANILPRNSRSLRVVEKLGFKNEGISKKYLKIDGEWEDHIHMVLLNDHFSTIMKKRFTRTESNAEI